MRPKISKKDWEARAKVAKVAKDFQDFIQDSLEDGFADDLSPEEFLKMALDTFLIHLEDGFFDEVKRK